jgi:putative DNA methylase
MDRREARGFHWRGYLPHIDAGETPVALTYRLAGALPASAIEEMDRQLRALPEHIRDGEKRKRIDAYLDAGHGECVLRHPKIAALAHEPILFHDGSRYRVHSFVIMPNHVHVLITPLQPVTRIIRTWKSFSARKSNRALGRKGEFWQADYFDRLLRNSDHFRRTAESIENNPVKAGLCATSAEWPFGSAFDTAVAEADEERAIGPASPGAEHKLRAPGAVLTPSRVLNRRTGGAR